MAISARVGLIHSRSNSYVIVIIILVIIVIIMVIMTIMLRQIDKDDEEGEDGDEDGTMYSPDGSLGTFFEQTHRWAT